MPVPPDDLWEKVRAITIEAERMAELDVNFGEAGIPQGAKLAIVRIDPITLATEMAGVIEAKVASADPLAFNLGMIADTTPSGTYLVSSCVEATCTIDEIMEAVASDTVPWRSFNIPAKIDDLGVLEADFGEGIAEYLDATWHYSDKSSADKFTIVISQNNVPIATLSDDNVLQKTFGFMNADQQGTRFYNTPFVDVAPRLPDMAPALTQPVPPSRYQFDVYVNGVLEATQQVDVAP